MDPEVAVLGAAALDWVARVEELPRPDGIVFVDHLQPQPGGTGGNVAEGIARLGHRVCFLGAVGDDDNGRRLLEAFRQAGVDTRGVLVRPGEQSATTLIAIDRQGERVIFSFGGAALYETAAEVDPQGLAGVRALVIADAFCEPALAAIDALPPGARVIFNPGGLMVSYGLDALRPILSRSDALIASAAEAQSLAGSAEIAAAARWLAEISAGGVVILTRGSQGAGYWSEGGWHEIAALAAEAVVDTTGAGDAFTSGVVSGMLQGLDWAEAVRYGCAVSALKVAHFGARGGLPDRRQVDARLQVEVTGAKSKWNEVK